MSNSEDDGRTHRRRRRAGKRGSGTAPSPAPVDQARADGTAAAPKPGPVGHPPESGGTATRQRREPAGERDSAGGRESTGRDSAGRESGSRDSTTPRDPERNWRDLTGNAPSQVGVLGAMRARDVARPTEEDLAAAERDVVIVRRQWQPPEGTTRR